MADEQTLPEARDKDRLDQFGETAVKVAASAVLATTLVGALNEPPRTDLMTLPEPVPIIQVYEPVEDDGIADEDDQDDASKERWRRILRLLKYFLVALALVASILFGALSGCAGAVAGTLFPSNDHQQQNDQVPAQIEDERGVAW
ncbi:MAG: hypothetical protein J6D34_10870 [Atopobiaceae bacterium]|nr:hypothetical protein [Atopobiaceae bacterium]